MFYYTEIYLFSFKYHPESEIFFFLKHPCHFIYLVHYITQGIGNKNYYDL